MSFSPIASTWPWRGIGWAFAFALALHLLAWSSFFSPELLKLNRNEASLVLNTRVLAPAPAPVAAVTTPKPQTQAPAVVRRRVPREQPAMTDKPPAIEEDKPLAQAETQAESMPETTETTVDTTTESLSLTAQTTPTDATPSEVASADIAPTSTAVTTATNPTEVTPTSTALAAPLAAPALTLNYPASARLPYQGVHKRKGQAQTGNGVLTWKIDGAAYELSLEATALVIIKRTEKSVGLLTTQGLVPQRYSSITTGRSEQATHFRAELGKIQFSNNRPEATWLPGGQDQISVMMQLTGLLNGQSERGAQLGTIQIQVAGTAEAGVWEFKVDAIADIQLPAGPLKVIKLTRSPRKEFDQKLEIWFAPQLAYMPVRIKLSSSTTPDEDFTDLVLSKMP